MDGRPKISLLYPRQNCLINKTLNVLGRIWDATNFSDFRLLLSKLPDTASWEEIYSSYNSLPHPTAVASLDLSTYTAGDYVLRTIATDRRGEQAVTDKYVTVVNKPVGSPSIVASYPPMGADNIPGNAPVVIQLDMPVNQPSITNESMNLMSSEGDRYSNVLYDYSSRTITIVPDQLYTADAFHYFLADDRIVNQQGVEMGSEFVSCFNTAFSAPTPDIDSLVPFRGQVQAPIDLESLAIYYNVSSEHRYVTVFSLVGDTIVNDTISHGWFPALVPVSGLLPKTYYLIRLSDSPTFDGESDYMSYFITEDTQMPVLTNHSPSADAWLVGLDDEIAVEFNKAINVYTIDSSSFFVLGPGGRVSGLFDFGLENTTTISFTPSSPLQSATDYTVVLTPHIQDNIGNPIDSMSWTFRTGVFETVDYDGGSIASDNVSVIFPRSTIESPTVIGLGEIPLEMVSYDASMEFTGLAADMTPTNDLSSEAVLTINVPDSIRSQYANLAIYRYDSFSGAWEHLGGSSTGGSISASIDKLSRYGVFAAGEATVTGSFTESVSLIPRVISPRMGGVNDKLQVGFKLASVSSVTAKIYDTRGQLVAILMDGDVGSVGDNLLTWDGRKSDGGYANDGLYILTIESDGQSVRKTFVILNK
jgi:hypothetical protein